MVNALCIIDMQPGFACQNYPETIKEIQGMVIRYMNDGMPIFAVEFSSYGPTIGEIADIYADYERLILVSKCYDGGADEILEAAERFLPEIPDRFDLCGINFGACVMSTAIGLNNNQKVSVYHKACNQPAEWSEDYWGNPKSSCEHMISLGINCTGHEMSIDTQENERWR